MFFFQRAQPLDHNYSGTKNISSWFLGWQVCGAEAQLEMNQFFFLVLYPIQD